MKFKVNSSELVSMLKIATKGHDSRDDSSFIYMKIKNNKLHVISRCQSAYFSGSVEVNNVEIDEDEPNIYYVDGEVLKKLAGIFPTAPINIEFEVNKDSRVFVAKYTGSKFKLPIISDMEEIAQPQISPLGMVQATEFMSMLNSLLKIVDSDPSAQEHPSSCLHLTFTNDKMMSMATDRFTIAELTKEFSGDQSLEGEEVVLMKHPQASLLSKTANPAEVLRLAYSDEYFGYVDGAGNLALVGRTDLDPLQYEQIKSLAGHDHHVVMECSGLKDALSTISKLSFANNSIIMYLDADEKSCKLSSIAGDVITVPITDLDIDESISVGFTRSVLQESLIPIDTDVVRMEWPAEGSTIYRLVPVDNGVDEDDVFVGVVPNAE